MRTVKRKVFTTIYVHGLPGRDPDMVSLVMGYCVLLRVGFLVHKQQYIIPPKHFSNDGPFINPTHPIPRYLVVLKALNPASLRG